MNDSLCKEMCKHLFYKELDSLMKVKSVNCNIISIWECLLLPKGYKLHHRSIQATKRTSSIYEYLTPCPLLNSETNEKKVRFKEEFEIFKTKTKSLTKN